MLVEVGRLWPGGFVDACVCDHCSLGFAWPLVEGDAGFYSVLHERVGYPRDRWEFRRARESFVGSTGRVLDVGAGAGDFLASLPTGVEKHAVEASPGLCAALTRRGIVAHASLDVAAAAGPYDVVTMFHVLQYFADPVAALARVAAMLTTANGGGHVLISAPNALAGADALDNLPAPPHPLTRWSPASLRRAAGTARLAVGGLEFIRRGPGSLLWEAHAKTRARAAARPKSLAGRIDGRRPGRLRTGLLALLAMVELPRVLTTARSRLRRSQILLICEAEAAPDSCTL